MRMKLRIRIVVLWYAVNVPHYWVLGGYGWVHGAEITKQRQLLTNTKT